MKHKTKLDIAAKGLVGIMEQPVKDLPASQRDAKWNAFNKVVAKVGNRAKTQVHPRTPAILSVAQKQA